MDLTASPSPPADSAAAGALFRVFARADWAALRAAAPPALPVGDLGALGGMDHAVPPAELADIYLPLSRLLALHVAGRHGLRRQESAFLRRPHPAAPYVIAVAGSVAVGKSTFARVLQALLSRGPDRPEVALVSTDGFLLPNRALEERGLMRRKGFPETYDLPRLIRFLADAKGGAPVIDAPVYSHVSYDIVPDATQRIARPAILILEGVNVLQPAPPGAHGMPGIAPADFVDFSIYLDAEDASLEAWFEDRLLGLQRTAFRDPGSYFRHLGDLPEAEMRALARRVWAETNLPNLRDHIRPTRERATVVLRKGADHAVGEVWLRPA
ncbi:MAG: type I pantothenate kinase [Proteobacteria bacterium]|nr:type I pantothenate kinase [Pseudomonadota bacterium]